MSVSKWAYSPAKCDGDYCPGDCDFCEKRNIEVDPLLPLFGDAIYALEKLELRAKEGD